MSGIMTGATQPVFATTPASLSSRPQDVGFQHRRGLSALDSRGHYSRVRAVMVNTQVRLFDPVST
jgi:hypothetical protein